MLSTIRRELKDNLGDQLRGFRHLIRALGDTSDSAVSRQHLPPVPLELDRIFGRTFQTVDGVMTTLETIVSPLRPSQSGEPTFADFDFYFPQANPTGKVEARLADELYAVLKLVAETVRPNQLILKTRVAAAAKHVLSTPRLNVTVDDVPQCCADLFLALVKHDPMVANTENADADSVKHYAALALLFGLAVSKRLGEGQMRSCVHDAILMCSLRADVFNAAASTGQKTEALVHIFASLLRHLP